MLIPSIQNIVVSDNYHIFQFNTDFVVFQQFLNFLNSPSSLVTALYTSGGTLLGEMSMQILIHICNALCGSRVMRIFTN